MFISLLLMMQVAEGLFQIAFGAFVIVALSIVGAHQTVNDAVLQLGHRQMAVVGGALIQSCVRLAALPLLSIQYQAANLMMATATIAVLLNYAFCRRRLRSAVESRSDMALDFSSEVRSIRRRSIPTDIFQAASGQFYYWALAFFAGPVAVAGFAAITRLGQLMFPLTLLFRGFFVPGFAKLKNVTSLQRYFFALLFLTAIATAPIVSIPLLWPEYVLKVLGPHYIHLADALVVYSAGVLFWVVGDLADQLLRSRGLMQPPIWSVTLDSIAFLFPLILAGEVTVLLTFWSFLCIASVRLTRIVCFALLSLRRGK
ncbi:hypothetical protein UNPF46_23915 [Bradyrhizobium sp. UNPF46]|nr:hypothetical protein UNPF46_23915 [Bradyrhizobium sp. UNPF46]